MKGFQKVLIGELVVQVSHFDLDRLDAIVPVQVQTRVASIGLRVVVCASVLDQDVEVCSSSSLAWVNSAHEAIVLFVTPDVD